MAVRNIREMGDEVLNKTCKEVKEITPRIQELIEDMLETMYEANGVGLAAPQVGILKRLVVIDPDGGKQPMINTYQENEYVIVGEGKVMNGDIGIVRHIDYLNYDAKADRWTNYNIYVQFDEDMIVYTPKDINNLLLGYCISIHKSQGTQAKAIISIIGKNHKSLTTRNLLYVAVSRAQEKLIEIGDKDCISKGLEKVETVDRTTWLGDLLTKS